MAITYSPELSRIAQAAQQNVNQLINATRGARDTARAYMANDIAAVLDAADDTDPVSNQPGAQTVGRLKEQMQLLGGAAMVGLGETKDGDPTKTILGDDPPTAASMVGLGRKLGV